MRRTPSRRGRGRGRGRGRVAAAPSRPATRGRVRAGNGSGPGNLSLKDPGGSESAWASHGAARPFGPRAAALESVTVRGGRGGLGGRWRLLRRGGGGRTPPLPGMELPVTVAPRQAARTSRAGATGPQRVDSDPPAWGMACGRPAGPGSWTGPGSRPPSNSLQTVDFGFNMLADAVTSRCPSPRRRCRAAQPATRPTLGCADTVEMPRPARGGLPRGDGGGVRRGRRRGRRRRSWCGSRPGVDSDGFGWRLRARAAPGRGPGDALALKGPAGTAGPECLLSQGDAGRRRQAAGRTSPFRVQPRPSQSP